MADSSVWDRNTGLPTSLGAYGHKQSSDESKIAATTGKSTTSTGVMTGTDVATSATRTVSSSINTTPEALQALNTLIGQLTDRPAISEAELNTKFPKATRIFDRSSGWLWQDPKTGFVLSEREAQNFNAKQDAARQQATQAAGTIAGGTEAQKTQTAERNTEIARGRATQDKYSKEAAIGDANFLINKSIADALEAAMPQISAGLDAAGTSRSTLAAAMTQKAAIKGGTEGAALGAQLGVQYGNINAQLAGVLEALTRSDPNSPAALLLQAINSSKGLYSASATNQANATVTDKTATTNTTAVEGPSGTMTNESTRIIPPSIPKAPVLGIATPASAKVAAPSNPYYAFQNTTPQNTPALETAYQSLYAPKVTDIYSIPENYDGGV